MVLLSLLSKEIKSFLGSIMGYLIILIFLLFLSLFLWVFKATGFNILEGGYATLTPMFLICPWLFMFLIPAISMKFFSEEIRSGTIELLYTKPISSWAIVLAKYLAALLLCMLTIIPTLIYVFVLFKLGEQYANLDLPATIGSYLGLIFLVSGFASIGIFASALTNNQIASFILACFISFIFYTGFDAISSLQLFDRFGFYVQKIGMMHHYESMSRGVLDTRDLIYFLSLSFLFLFLTQKIIEFKKA